MDGGFSSRHTPTRYLRALELRERYGSLALRLEQALTEGDALADAAEAELGRNPDRDVRLRQALALDPAASPVLAALVRETQATPAWLDPAQLELAGRVVRAGGLRSGLVLALGTLVTVYRSPAGTKPLALTGRFVDHAERRLYETAHFVLAMTAPGAFGTGQARLTALSVRLLHAKVRRGLDRSPKWRADAWGRPLNQADTLAMTAALSVTFVDGLRRLGVAVSEREADALAHLWAFVGQLLGVAPDLAAPTFAQARRTLELIEASQGAPDGDSRGLCHALIEGDLTLTGLGAEKALRAHRVAFFYELSRLLVGDAHADALGFPRSSRWAKVAALLAKAPVGVPLESMPGVGPVLARVMGAFASAMVARGLMETATRSGPAPSCPFARTAARMGRLRALAAAVRGNAPSGAMAWA